MQNLLQTLTVPVNSDGNINKLPAFRLLKIFNHHQHSGFLLHVSITVITAATVLHSVMVKSKKTDNMILQ